MKVRYYITLLVLFFFGAGMTAQEVRYSPKFYSGRADGYINSNAWNSAKREIDAGLELFADDPELRYQNGLYYYFIGDLKTARYNLVRAVQADDQLFRAKRILVDIEDNLGHYTSAICYINELLEFQPYDRDLWRRKIAFYRKMGNDVEADAALERLSHIYPNDTLVIADVRRRNQENWDNALGRSSLYESAENLEKWIDIDPGMRDYYIELVSVYVRMGEYEKAIGAVNRGLVYFPNDPVLIDKGAGVMSELGLYTQALTFVKSRQPESKAYENLMYEVAADARMHDPYEANGRLYLATQDPDALSYLLNTAMTRGYYDDARYYLAESMALYGRTPSLLMKLYTLEKATGNEASSIKLLTELYELNPEDEELHEAYATLMMQLVDADMNDELWADANMHLDRVLELLPDTADVWAAAVSRKIMVLGHLERYDDAQALCVESSRRSPANRRRFAWAYEELMASRLRFLVEEERYPEALTEAEALLEVVPESEAALRCAINMSQTLKKQDKYHEYAARGYAAYPGVPYFRVKQAIALQEQGSTAGALNLLKPADNDDEYMNPQLTAAHSGISQEWAGSLMKKHMPDVALEVIDTALVYDPENRELLYNKGLVYESQKQFADAYDYQSRYYEPSNAEQEEYMQHMRYLAFRSYRNRLDATYTHASYDSHYQTLASTGHLYSLASISYSRLSASDTYTGQINYKGIDGYHDDQTSDPGGVGLEFMGQWEHSFNARWSGMASLALSTQFFNKVSLNVGASYYMEQEWTPSIRLGYRLTPPTYLHLSGENKAAIRNDKLSLLILSPSINKAWERINVTANTDLTIMSGGLFYNVGLKGKFLLNNDNMSSVTFMTGFGSFPELTFFEQTALSDVSHTNAMVGLDIQYLLTHQLCLGITGTWNTCYNPYYNAAGTLVDSYRNIYTVSLQTHIVF